LRARKRSADEVGGLVDAFNQMLDETQRSQNERQRTASALGESEERLRLAQQVARIGTFEWNIQTGKNIWTPQLEEMHGLKPGTFEGTHQAWEQAVHPDDRARMVQRVGDAMQTGKFADEWRVVWPDGTVRWIAGRGSVFKDAAGRPLRLLGVNIDVTERRQAEEALRESEERFRSMADNISPLAWMANADGWIFFYNRRWFEYTGTTLDDMQGWGWEKAHHPDHVRRVVEKWSDHVRRGEAWEDTFPLRGQDGQYRWFLSRAFPIRNAQGEITRWFGTNTDVTELRETQEALERAQAQLQQHATELERVVADRTVRLRETIGELEAFSYSIAHDMRASSTTLPRISCAVFPFRPSGSIA